jgi:hypothetical protein
VLVVLAGLVGCGDDADALTRDEAEKSLRDYLSAVSDGDYSAAAEPLVLGDEPLEERDDLEPLATDALTVASVADGLARYCAAGCPDATDMTLVPEEQDDAFVATVVFGEPRGHPLNRTLRIMATPDGEVAIRGLPPSGTGEMISPGGP